MNNYVKCVIAGAIVGGMLIVADEAYADAGRVISIEDKYKVVTKRIPHNEYTCETVEVPIYGQERFDQGDAIVGGIIGGIIGNQIGKGSGRTAATGVGAIAGSIIGGKKDGSVVGYRREEQCRNTVRYETETKEVYSHSIVNFVDDRGERYSIRFTK